jgi:predicted transcriptional regulator
MSATTSLKLPDELKARISELAVSENMTAHAYMVETLDRATQQALRHREFVASAKESKAAYERDAVTFAHEDVVRHFKARLAGAKPPPLKPAKRSRVER